MNIKCAECNSESLEKISGAAQWVSRNPGWHCKSCDLKMRHSAGSLKYWAIIILGLFILVSSILSILSIPFTLFTLSVIELRLGNSFPKNNIHHWIWILSFGIGVALVILRSRVNVALTVAFAVAFFVSLGIGILLGVGVINVSFAETMLIALNVATIIWIFEAGITVVLWSIRQLRRPFPITLTQSELRNSVSVSKCGKCGTHLTTAERAIGICGHCK